MEGVFGFKSWFLNAPFNYTRRGLLSEFYGSVLIVFPVWYMYSFHRLSKLYMFFGFQNIKWQSNWPIFLYAICAMLVMKSQKWSSTRIQLQWNVPRWIKNGTCQVLGYGKSKSYNVQMLLPRYFLGVGRPGFQLTSA